MPQRFNDQVPFHEIAVLKVFKSSRGKSVSSCISRIFSLPITLDVHHM